jgi:hypothetical protein
VASTPTREEKGGLMVNCMAATTQLSTDSAL